MNTHIGYSLNLSPAEDFIMRIELPHTIAFFDPVRIQAAAESSRRHTSPEDSRNEYIARLQSENTSLRAQVEKLTAEVTTQRLSIEKLKAKIKKPAKRKVKARKK